MRSRRCTGGLRAFAFWPTVFALLGCAGGSETGNPALEVGLGLRSSQPELVAVSEGADGTVIEEAWVSLGRLVVFSEGGCAEIDEYEYDGPTLAVVDLARPDVSVITELPEGEHCGLVLPLQRETPAAEIPTSAPAELANHSVVLRGRRADGTPFLLTHPEADELELVPEADALVVERGVTRWLLSFDVAVWMADVDLDAASVGDDGVIAIDAEHNRTSLDAFEEAAECSLELFEDVDGDWELDPADPRLAHCSPD